MALSLRLTDEETALVKNYAQLKGVSVSQLIRDAIIDKIEEEYDLQAYKKAFNAYKKNPITYSHDEVAAMLELD